MIDRILASVRRFATNRANVWSLFFVSAGEATVIPVPLELILFPLMQMNRDRIWVLATSATLGCLVGALAFYATAYFAMETLGQNLITAMGWQDRYAATAEFFVRHGFWAIILAGIAPIPLQLAMLAAGATAYPLVPYCVAILISRVIRYFGIAWLVHRYGDTATHNWHHNRPRFVMIGIAVAGAIWSGSAIMGKALAG